MKVGRQRDCIPYCDQVNNYMEIQKKKKIGVGTSIEKMYSIHKEQFSRTIFNGIEI